MIATMMIASTVSAPALSNRRGRRSAGAISRVTAALLRAGLAFALAAGSAVAAEPLVMLVAAGETPGPAAPPVDGVRIETKTGSGAARTFKAALRKGDAALADIPLAVLARESALYAADQIPFLAVTPDQSARLYAILAPHIAARLSEEDLVLIALAPGDPVGLLARRPVGRAADLAGMTLWAPDAATVRLAELLGAKPVKGTDPAKADALFVTAAEAAEIATREKPAARGWIFHALDGWRRGRAIVGAAAALDALPPDRRRALVDGFAGAVTPSAEPRGATVASGLATVTASGDLAADLGRLGQTMADDWMPGAGADGAAVLSAVRGGG